ncbi:MAG: hypothetical protein ABIH72_04535 [archaeon]
MAHQGRVHIISTAAEEISKIILNRIPRDKLKVKKGLGLRRPLWFKIEFQDTAEERAYLRGVAERYNSQNSPENHLIVHGTQDCSSLCQILLDGKLKHNKGIENYGSLAAKYDESVIAGGYWDHGWGIFVTTPKIIDTNYELSERNNYLVVPVKDLKGVLFPHHLVEVVRYEFPKHSSLLKSYGQFAQELEKHF